MILTEIITEDRYEFLKLWHSCVWMTCDEYPKSIFMVRDNEVLFQQEWENKYLWCKHSSVWSVFQVKFGYNYSQIKELISSVLKEHLKQGVLTPLVMLNEQELRLKEHLKQGVLTPIFDINIIDISLKEHLKQGVLTP